MNPIEERAKASQFIREAQALIRAARTEHPELVEWDPALDEKVAIFAAGLQLASLLRAESTHAPSDADRAYR